MTPTEYLGGQRPVDVNDSLDVLIAAADAAVGTSDDPAAPAVSAAPALIRAAFEPSTHSGGGCPTHPLNYRTLTRP